ncbi:MAG: stage III sporulation protein AF [Tissierellia bacterium]|nr:stage III sporulation protein AF [Tissierellia bacterium]
MGVISFINSWLKDIVVLFILISIAELIMPKGNLKKYIRLVIGLLIIYTIISPFARLFRLDFSLDKVVFNYAKPETFNSIDLEDFYLKQEKQIEKIYLDKIIEDLKVLIESDTDYELVDGDITILKDEDNYGEIDYLTLYLKENKGNKDSDTIYIEKIGTIKVNLNLDKEYTEDEDDESIKLLISNSYGIEKDKISIKIYKKGIGEINE